MSAEHDITENFELTPHVAPADATGVDIVTFGCRLNAYESEVMKELAEAAGLSGAVIVNTCAVTAEAVRKAKQEIRRLARENPGAAVIVTGCAAQTEPETFAAMATRGPRAQTVEFSGVGHAPMLMDPAQIAVVRDFLLGT